MENSTKSGRQNRLAVAARYLVILLTSVWAAMALAIDLPFPWLRIIAAAVFALAILLIVFRLKSRSLWQLLTCLLCCGLVLVWWLTLKPSNEGRWQPDVSKTAWAEVQGSTVTIHNLRNCNYRAELEYT